MSAVERIEAEYDPAALSGFTAFDGIKAAGVGEDGDTLILGHHDDETTWAAFAAYCVFYNGEQPETPPADYYDLRRVFGVFSNHSEGCEQVGCTCREDQNCAACLRGQHESCEGDAVCECGSDYDHERVPDECLSCECYCDEYEWWIAETKTGHPVTWVSFSYAKARARREAENAEATA